MKEIVSILKACFISPVLYFIVGIFCLFAGWYSDDFGLVAIFTVFMAIALYMDSRR